MSSSKKKTRKKHDIRKIILRMVLIIFLLTVVIPFIGGIGFYRFMFGKRYDPDDEVLYSAEDFEGLSCVRKDLTGNRGQNLAGYLYYGSEYDSEDIRSIPQHYKGIVIFAHGLGASQAAYVQIYDYLVDRDLLVFAYDATGTATSEGSSIRGFPQGTEDMNSAIDFVYDNITGRDYPVATAGHSAGAFAACSVLGLHPEVRAVLCIAGFNSSPDYIAALARPYAGPAIEPQKPLISFYEYFLFGNTIYYTAQKGFESSDAKIMAVYSDTDKTVPASGGIDIWKRSSLPEDKILYYPVTGRAHGDVWRSDSKEGADTAMLDKFCGVFDSAISQKASVPSPAKTWDPVLYVIIILGAAAVFAVILLIVRHRAKIFRLSYIEGVDKMDGRDFELWCADFLKHNGFSRVEVTSESRDNGVDILCRKDGQTYAVQCKRMESSVPNKAVQEVYTGMEMYGCDRAAVITNNHFSPAACDTAEKTGVELWDRDWILSRISKDRKAGEDDE
ncbi:MAG: restriction endonuclease [Clostridiales bacterium]|nr:restriction endonuclease [Clostridiales bacterium]